jgi:hypothetical protein
MVFYQIKSTLFDFFDEKWHNIFTDYKQGLFIGERSRSDWRDVMAKFLWTKVGHMGISSRRSWKMVAAHVWWVLIQDIMLDFSGWREFSTKFQRNWFRYFFTFVFRKNNINFSNSCSAEILTWNNFHHVVFPMWKMDRAWKNFLGALGLCCFASFYFSI